MTNEEINQGVLVTFTSDDGAELHGVVVKDGVYKDNRVELPGLFADVLVITYDEKGKYDEFHSVEIDQLRRREGTAKRVHLSGVDDPTACREFADGDILRDFEYENAWDGLAPDEMPCEYCEAIAQERSESKAFIRSICKKMQP